jgi:hypothetical protein
MKPASDADTFSERLMTAPLRVLRWASPAAGSRRDGKASALGRAASEPADSSRRSRSRWNIPVDYHPSVPELIAVSLGREQRVRVRVSFGQLQAIVRPGAQDFADGVAARSFGSALVSAGRTAASAQAGSSRPSSVAWLASGGHYDLTFSRPSGRATDPAAALADRTCMTCGATYQSELAIACQHCQASRPLPWGDWRLADAQPVL